MTTIRKFGPSKDQKKNVLSYIKKWLKEAPELLPEPDGDNTGDSCGDSCGKLTIELIYERAVEDDSGEDFSIIVTEEKPPEIF